jgi:peptidoglycan/xylan/chitin deacetylase (PgdA/CDA1 family)
VARHCEPIALDELVRAAASGLIPERAVAVTLDDGYLDALTVASPILVEFGVPATFFVNTDRLDEEHERWWDVLERVLSVQTLPGCLRVSTSAGPHELPTRTADDRARSLARLHELARPLGARERRLLVDDVLARSGVPPRARETHRVLTGDELRALANRGGHTIGGHTTHHLALTAHPPDVKRREVSENKADLERLIGRTVHLFSYPYGEADAETIAAVADAGYRAAVTVQPGCVAAGVNRLLLPRFEVTADEARRFPSTLQRMFDGRQLCA